MLEDKLEKAMYVRRGQLFRVFKTPRKQWLTSFKVKRHPEIYETRPYRLKDTKQEKLDMLRGKIERSKFNLCV